MSAAPPQSVLLPVRDARAYLDEALASVLAQSFADFELIAVDDGSTDGSLEILERHAARDARIAIVPGPRQGVAAALNAGLAACRAPLVARIDADDVARPGRFALQLAYLDAHPGCGAVGGQVDIIDEDGDSLSWISTPLDHAAIVAALRRGEGAIVHPSVVLRRDVVAAAGGYGTDKRAEDVDLFLRMSERARLANLPDHVLHHRKHEASVTSRWTRAAVADELGAAAPAEATPWVEAPTGEALQLARMGIAIHAGFYAAALKYARRLLATRPRRVALVAGIALRGARSGMRRLVNPQRPPRGAAPRLPSRGTPAVRS